MILGLAHHQPRALPAPTAETGSAAPNPDLEPWLDSESFDADGGPGTSTWLVTFTDLIGLLLAMFIMIFAMSNLDSNRWQSMMGALDSTSGQPGGPQRVRPAAESTVPPLVELPGEDLDYLSSLLRERMDGDPVLAEGILQSLEDRVVLSFPGELLFAPGAVEPGTAAREALFRLGGLLRNLDNRVEIAGHADPTAPPEGFESNWELSLARALAVARLLREAGYIEALRLRGYGDSRADWVSPRLAAPRRQELARRVDISIHRSRSAGP